MVCFFGFLAKSTIQITTYMVVFDELLCWSLIINVCIFLTFCAEPSSMAYFFMFSVAIIVSACHIAWTTKKSKKCRTKKRVLHPTKFFRRFLCDIRVLHQKCPSAGKTWFVNFTHMSVVAVFECFPARKAKSSKKSKKSLYICDGMHMSAVVLS